LFVVVGWRIDERLFELLFATLNLVIEVFAG
jgi:hypothetical protein